MERIIVGIDGSEPSRSAVRFALEIAQRRGALVEAVLAYTPPSVVNASIPGPPPGSTSMLETATKAAATTLDGVLDGEILRGRRASVPVERIVVEGHAARTLLRIARGADLLVVGSRGRGGFTGLLLGSVSQHTITHAPCPVAVVPAGWDAPGGEDGTAMPRVVVGVDGSQGSRTALRWALDEADSRKAAMDVVLVFTYSTGAAAWGLADAAYEPLVSFEDARTAAEHRLDDTLKALPDDRKVEVHPHVVEGFPAEELVQASANADLLVVGTRGAGGFRGLLLGSVSQQCVHHMACPVVVVPDR